MPTPFSHLRVAQHLLTDPQIPAAVRDALVAERSAFLLGSIAADARINNGMKRSDTHFYQYDEPIRDHAWRLMLKRYPDLCQPEDTAQQALVAAYVAHLGMDEYWTLEMLQKYFWGADWADHREIFFVLHILLTYLDERDYALIEGWQSDTLFEAGPQDWLPFMSDTDLLAWRDFIAGQLVAGSETIAVLSERVRRPPEDFQAVLDSPSQMQAMLWDRIPPGVVEAVEQGMYEFARAQMLIYLEDTA